MDETILEVTEESSTTDSDSLQSNSDSSEVVANESVENDSSGNEESSTDIDSSSVAVSSSVESDDSSDESSLSSEDSSSEDSEELSSTVIQVEESEDGELSVTELDVTSLNILSESYVESMLAVTPTSNDYYTFIDSPILEYFEGLMANYPLNQYKAYHLRHYVSSSSYSSYYDDYYYLFYDYPENSCLELYKPYNSNSYTATWGSAEILDSTISYGSEQGWSDLRGGVNYVSWLSALGVLACVCVLYIVHAIFRHLHS